MLSLGNEIIVNKIKTGEITPTHDFVDGKQVYVKKIDFGTLPNTATKTVASGINFNNYELVKMEGICRHSNNTAFPLPFSNPSDNYLSIMCNITSGNAVSISTGSDRTQYNATFYLYIIEK